MLFPRNNILNLMRHNDIWYKICHLTQTDSSQTKGNTESRKAVLSVHKFVIEFGFHVYRRFQIWGEEQITTLKVQKVNWMRIAAWDSMIKEHLTGTERNRRTRGTRTRWSHEMERAKDDGKARAPNLEFASNPRGFVFANKSLPRMSSPIQSDCTFRWISPNLHARTHKHKSVCLCFQVIF